MSPLRVCLVASNRHPIRQPFAGGLESLTHALAGELARRGHDVTLFAAPGSDPALPVKLLPLATCAISDQARQDRHAPDDQWLADHHAYLSLMLDLMTHGTDDFDVVHNNSLHHLPLAMAPALRIPLVTTLHTPPLPWLESAVSLAPGASAFTAVSASTAQAWAHVVESTTIPNGVDLRHWRYGDGGGPAVWSGRLVPEKAPHEAIDACRRARQPIVLTGPAHDAAYFRAEIEPRLGQGVQYRGHVDHGALGRLLRAASVAVVTPAWDEPFGLVAAEAMACGTPVAAYARGALGAVLGADGGVLARGGDVDDLARAVREARGLDRSAVRRHAELTCSLERMVDGYERFYSSLIAPAHAA